MNRLTRWLAALTLQPLLASAGGTAPATVSDWAAIGRPLAKLGDRVVAMAGKPDDAQLRMELYQDAVSGLAGAYLPLVHASSDYPEFVPFAGVMFNFAAPNPDDVYYMTPIDDGGTYRISGYRGSVRTVDFQLMGGAFMTRGEGKTLGSTLANYDADSLRIGSDGSFDVILSPQRPVGHTGDWWKLEPQTTSLLVRQIAYDWLREQDGRFAIERLDRPAIKPRPGKEEIASRLRQLPAYAEAWVGLNRQYVQRFAAKGLVNKVAPLDNSSGDGGHVAQKYVIGVFDLQPDEALILETEVPSQCGYWGFQLTNESWGAIDYINRQTSLNGHQARLDKDGKFRAVIAAADPGVPNWLDTAGYRRGTIFGRWKGCNGNPLPSITLIKAADIRRHLPADTPIVTAQQRDGEIRLRRTGAQLRRRW